MFSARGDGVLFSRRLNLKCIIKHIAIVRKSAMLCKISTATCISVSPTLSVKKAPAGQEVSGFSSRRLIRPASPAGV